jgi:hypothetical protein
MRISLKSIAAIALCASAGASSASLLAGFDPYTAAPNGVGADPANTAYTQVFTAPSGATLDKIVWWGYRQREDPPGTADDFTVQLDAVTQIGTLTTLSYFGFGNADLVQYTLDVADTVLTATELTIVSNAPSFEWYWQSADAATFADPGFRVAFNLLGTLPVATTPEPGSLALVALAGLALLVAQRRRAV